MKFKSLRTDITIWTIAAMLILPVFVGAVIITKQIDLGKRFNQTIGESDTVLKATLLRDLEQAMMVNQLDGVRGVLKEVSKFRGVRGVYLTDFRGRMVLAYGHSQEPKLTEAQKKTLYEKGGEINEFYHEGGESVRLVGLPIVNKSQCRICHMLTTVNGALIIKQRSVDVVSETSFLVGTMITSLLIASGAAMLTLLIMLSRKVISPLRAITSVTRKVGQCDLNVKVPVEGEGEVKELALSFNRMIEDLKVSRDQVEDRSVKCEQAYRSMQVAQKKLIQSEKLAAIGTLVAGIAHEINNPVGIIANRAECMLMDAKEKHLDEQCTDDLKVINRHAGRIAEITSSLLTFARQAPVEMSAVDVNSVVEDTLFLVEKQFEKESIKVAREFSVPSPVVQGNYNRLQHVLLNILNNSRDAMPDGGTITVSTANSDNVVEIVVRDSGQGIPAEVLDHIFDPFFTTKDVGKGTGLGLAVSYGMIQDMGGVIEADSEPGAGTTFTITLPKPKEG
jgi:C4-dicarboxylate-specific signal transduction histidine kinase